MTNASDVIKRQYADPLPITDALVPVITTGVYIGHTKGDLKMYLKCVSSNEVSFFFSIVRPRSP